MKYRIKEKDGLFYPQYQDENSWFNLWYHFYYANDRDYPVWAMTPVEAEEQLRKCIRDNNFIIKTKK